MITNWLRSMHWYWMKLRFLNKIWMAKVGLRRQVRLDKLEMCAVQASIADPDVANAQDA